MNKGFGHIALIILLLITVLAIASYSVSKTHINPAINVVEPTNTEQKSTEVVTVPSASPIPTPNTSTWKTYTEQGRRYKVLIGYKENIFESINDFKRYKFLYPPDWSTSVKPGTESRNQTVRITNPESKYVVEVYYNSSRDYENQNLYELDNGIIIQTFEEYNEDSKKYYTWPNTYDHYDLLLEGPSEYSSIVGVRIPITDEKGELHQISDIKTAREILNSFDVIEGY